MSISPTPILFRRELLPLELADPISAPRARSINFVMVAINVACAVNDASVNSLCWAAGFVQATRVDGRAVSPGTPVERGQRIERQ